MYGNLTRDSRFRHPLPDPVLAGSLFFDGSVTRLAGLPFLRINALARPAGSTRSRQGNQFMREHCCQLLARAKGSMFFSLDSLRFEDDIQSEVFSSIL